MRAGKQAVQQYFERVRKGYYAAACNNAYVRRNAFLYDDDFHQRGQFDFGYEVTA
jgi:hypothetical protein